MTSTLVSLSLSLDVELIGTARAETARQIKLLPFQRVREKGGPVRLSGVPAVPDHSDVHASRSSSSRSDCVSKSGGP